LESLFDRIRKGLIVSLLILFTFIPQASATDNDQIAADILTAVEKKYTGQSFKSKFKQISTLAALDITEEASGNAFFSHPGKMKWEYLSPERHEIITNGKLLWVNRPQENQVMQGDAASFFKTGAGGAFLSDISLIRKNYIVGLIETSEDYVEIKLTALKKTPDLSLIVIRISQKTHEIKRIVTYNAYDDSTLFEFTNIQFKSLDPALFEFKVPPGSNIIDLE
jgi:outer membrane lipoprotein carrier protein